MCELIDGNYIDTPPVLVIEILSPSTRPKDLNNKYQLYQDFGIKDYVIVDPDDNSVKVFVLNSEETYVEQSD